MYMKPSTRYGFLALKRQCDMRGTHYELMKR